MTLKPRLKVSLSPSRFILHLTSAMRTFVRHLYSLIKFFTRAFEPYIAKEHAKYEIVFINCLEAVNPA